MPRTVKALHPAVREDIGDLKTVRPLPGPGIEHVDPFLFLNHHGPQTYGPSNTGLPFGPHPHRGFETVTFILEGELAHLDSSGGQSIITAGGVQWMTAGRGLVHAEVSPEEFKRHGGPLEILQLWVNLPAKYKMIAPRYIGLQKSDIPSVPIDDGRAVLNLVAGEWDSRRAPIQSITDIHMVTAYMLAGGLLEAAVAPGRNVFLYVVRGAIRVAGQKAPSCTLVELHDDDDHVAIEAVTDTVLLFGHAPPLNEPVVAHGPFVMNTPEEIRQAFADYKAGRFGGL